MELGVDMAGYRSREGVTLLSGVVERVLEGDGGRGPGTAAVVEVTIIRPGESSNHHRYRPGVLQEAAHLFDGAAAFCDHPGPMDAGRAGGRSLRDLVGVYEAVRWDEQSQSIRGRLRLYSGAAWLAGLIGEVIAERERGGAAPNVGVSADMLVLKARIGAGGPNPLPLPVAGRGVEGAPGGASSLPLTAGRGVEGAPGGASSLPLTEGRGVEGASGGASPLPVPVAGRGANSLGLPGAGTGVRSAVWEVEKIVAVNSADLVFQPAAGGRFERIVEGIAEPFEDAGGAGTGEFQNNDYRASAAEAAERGEIPMCARCGAEPCGCEADGAARDVRSPTPERGAEAGDRPGEMAAGVVARELEAVRSARLELCRTMLDQRLAAEAAGGQGRPPLPAPAGEWLRGRFRDRVFEAAELDAEIASVRGMLGGIVAPGVVRGMGFPRDAGRGNQVFVGATALERVQLAMDRLFGLPLPDAASDVPRFSGIREAYIAITGDAGFTGRYDWERSVVREANEVTTSVMAQIVASSMTKRLVRDYQSQPKWWLPIVVRTSIKDMKAQDRVLLNDFAALATVSENATYANLAWDDAKETYTPAKKGNIVYVTMDSWLNI